MYIKNIKLIISYDGTRYSGWQRQGNTDNTIQERLEKSISKYVNEEVEVVGSGRTDAGVHALGQVVNFHITDKALELVDKVYGNDEGKRDALNEMLPNDIRVLKWDNASPRFHARLNATKKHYRYVIDNGDVANIFDRKYLMRVEEKLDIEAMKTGAGFLVGEHDFKNFCSNKKMKKSTVREIYDIKISKDNGIITIDYFGNGFLYNMVRIMTGILIEIGQGYVKPEGIEKIFNEEDRRLASFIAPAKGLFLCKVWYD